MNATPEVTQLQAHRSQVSDFLQGNKEATDFVCDMFIVLHIWDDLIDKDKKLTDSEIHYAFWLALMKLPCNPFYTRNFNTLQPILANSILNWQAANTMENAGDRKDQEIAFILRGAYTDLLTISAYLVGGLSWVTLVTPDIRRWAHQETFQEYLHNLADEKEARNVQQRT